MLSAIAYPLNIGTQEMGNPTSFRVGIASPQTPMAYASRIAVTGGQQLQNISTTLSTPSPGNPAGPVTVAPSNAVPGSVQTPPFAPGTPGTIPVGIILALLLATFVVVVLAGGRR
jgi:hypothetical protein